MNKQTQAIRNDVNQLAEGARPWLAATADVAGEEEAGELRNRLTTALGPFQGA